jgi:hypothetical protein
MSLPWGKITLLYRIFLIALVISGFFCSETNAQIFLKAPNEDALSRLFRPADTLNKSRVWTISGVGATAYGAAIYGLNELWYTQYPRSSFQLFNDWGEWMQMDKVGHTVTTFQYTRHWHQGYMWAGMSRRKALVPALIGGWAYQAALEVLDGHSAEWGFSIPDMAFNTLGSGLYLGQELLWNDQRISFKISSDLGRKYSNDPISSTNGLGTSSLGKRADDLYGHSIAQIFLKDYNAQTYWMSVNLRAFLPENNGFVPKWLNLAVGYGAQNMYGGFGNQWSDKEGNSYFSPTQRQRQFYLSPDIDFTRIKVKHPFLKSMLVFLNVFKLPAPALEYNTGSGMQFHWLHF